VILVVELWELPFPFLLYWKVNKMKGFVTTNQATLRNWRVLVPFLSFPVSIPFFSPHEEIVCP